MFAVHVRHVNLINDRVAVDVAIALVPPVHRKHLAPTYRPPQFRWVSEQNAQRQLSRPFPPPPPPPQTVWLRETNHSHSVTLASLRMGMHVGMSSVAIALDIHVE